MDKKIKQLLDLVRDYVKDTFTPLTTRIDALEKRQPERGEKGEPGTKGIDGEKGSAGDRGEPGLDGKDGYNGVDGKDGAPGRDGERGADGADGAPGKDGAPGRDGVDGKDGLAAAAAGVDGKDGVPGERGVDGKEGAAGRDGVDGKDGAPGRDGVDGKDGAPGERGADGKDGAAGVDGKEGQPGRDAVDGKDGAPGADGKSLTIDDVSQWLDANFAKWALAVERRVFDAAEKAIAAMPVPKDGVDGLRVEDLQLVGRTLQLKSGDQVLKSIVLPMPVYRGVFDDGETYDVHDMVTFGGSVWVAVSGEGIRGKPGTVDAWKLAVKKGRDGRDARTPA